MEFNLYLDKSGKRTNSYRSRSQPISPERFIYRGLPSIHAILTGTFSEVSMRQYMKDEIRERLQMIRDTAESAQTDAASLHPMKPCMHLAAGLGKCSC